MDDKKVFPYKVFFYAVLVSVIYAFYYGSKTSESFLSGSTYPILYDAGMLLGMLTFPWLLALPIVAIACIYSLITKKKILFLTKWVYSTAVIASVLLILTYQVLQTFTHHPPEEKQIALSVQQDLKESLEGGVSSGTKLEGDFGDLAPLVEILNELRAEVANTQKEIQDEIDQYDFASLFSEQNITDLLKIAALKDRLNTTISKFENVIIKHREIQDRAIEKVQKAEMPSAVKNDFLEGWERSRPEKDRVFNAFMENEINIYKQLASILDFFEKRQGDFKFFDGRPHFLSSQDVEDFNALISEMRELEARRNDLAPKMVQQVSEGVDALESHR